MGSLLSALPTDYLVSFPILFIGAIGLAVFQRYLVLPIIWLLGVLVTKSALLLSASQAARTSGNELMAVAIGGLLAALLALFGMWFRWIHLHEIPRLAPGQVPAGSVLLPGATLAFMGNPGWYPYVPGMEWMETGLAALPVLLMGLFLVLIVVEKRRARALE